jgi:hypothetical protein
MSDTDSHDSFLEELERVLNLQREEEERRVVYDSVKKLHELVPLQENSMNNSEIVAVELYVVSVSPFSKGWHYQLTNNAAAGANFQAAKVTLSSYPASRATTHRTFSFT